jgi:hypothetical protein
VPEPKSLRTSVHTTSSCSQHVLLRGTGMFAAEALTFRSRAWCEFCHPENQILRVDPPPNKLSQEGGLKKREKEHIP